MFGTLQPSLIIIGAQKSGTTAMFEHLSRHPAVAPPRTKEINFFGCDARFERGTAFYESFFPPRTGPRDSRITLEATTHYLYAAEKAAARLRSFDESIRLVAILRDPVERAYSAWQMYQRIRRTDATVFATWVCNCDGEDAAASFRPRREQYGTSFVDDVVEELDTLQVGQQIAWPVIEHGHYVDQLRFYFDQFPAEQLLVVDSARMRADPRSELRRVEKLVGLDHHDWPAADVTPRFVGGYSEPPTPEARRILAAHYRPFTDRLQVMLGRELDWA